MKFVAPLKLEVFDVWNRPENVASAANVAMFENETGPANPAAPATDDVPVTVRFVTVTLPLNVGVPLFTAAAEMPPLLKTCEKNAIHAGERFLPSLVISVDGTGGKLIAGVPEPRQLLR